MSNTLRNFEEKDNEQFSKTDCNPIIENDYLMKKHLDLSSESIFEKAYGIQPIQQKMDDPVEKQITTTNKIFQDLGSEYNTKLDNYGQTKDDVVINIDQIDKSVGIVNSVGTVNSVGAIGSINTIGKTKKLTNPIEKKNKCECCLELCSCCCQTADDIATCYLYMWIINSLQNNQSTDSNTSTGCCNTGCCANCDCGNCDCGDCDCGDCDSV